MERSQHLKTTRRAVIKIGTRVLTDADGCISMPAITSLIRQITDLIKKNMEVVLVSSGAIAAGRALLKSDNQGGSIPEKQALAAIGQSHLINMYQHALAPYNKRAAQVLLTRDDLAHRHRYLNARNTLARLLALKVIPIVNENDTVVVEEIKFGDNDSLSARVALLVDADLLILLTNAPGLCTLKEDGNIQESSPIPFIEKITPEIQSLAKGSEDPCGTGGMFTKLEAARIATQAGLPAVIAQGQRENVIPDIIQGEQIGTFFAPLHDRLTHKKHWIAYSLPQKGELVLDAGAVEAIMHRGKSLLPSGVASVDGRFEIGDMVACIDSQGREFARGITHYSSHEIQKIAGRKSNQIESILGYQMGDEIIHRDELVVLNKKGNKNG